MLLKVSDIFLDEIRVALDDEQVLQVLRFGCLREGRRNRDSAESWFGCPRAAVLIFSLPRHARFPTIRLSAARPEIVPLSMTDCRTVLRTESTSHRLERTTLSSKSPRRANRGMVGAGFGGANATHACRN